MTSIVEQAVRRLEELRRSGVDVPEEAGAGVPNGHAGDVGPAKSLVSAAVERLERHPAAPESGGLGLAGPSRAHAAAGAADASQSVVRPRIEQIDLAKLAAMGYVTPHMMRSQIASEFRVIKRPLLTNINGQGASRVDHANLIMVTSALAGEGKTFVAINLAISLAMELDKRVLLVDADVSRPSVLQRLGIARAPGLLDVLTDRTRRMNDLVMHTNIDKLCVLPAGAPQGHATELLASDSMSRLVRELSAQDPDRIVVFDAPPLLPSTESRVLASHMGQIVLVVAAESTLQRQVEQALVTIESCPIVLPLLNKTTRSEVGTYYGYYAPVGS